MHAIDPAVFASVMARIGQFETNPYIAVGVSGGPDSLALLHLAAEWARSCGGTVIALTVDHGIRPESAGEAGRVAQWASLLGVEHLALKWSEPDAAASALQQRARVARLQLLAKAASDRGILHLMLAHQADDQAETLLLRLAKGSGPDGLSGMSAIRHDAEIRILRPLLEFPRERLMATCRAREQDWVEDPSNISDRFARPRLRASWGVLETEGLRTDTLAHVALLSAQARAALERGTALILARHARILPQGYAELALAGWQAVDIELRRRVLAQLLPTIGGGEYRPMGDRLDEIARLMPDKTTLGGCLIETHKGHVRIMREDRTLPGPKALKPGQWTRWDRFQVFSAEPVTIRQAADAIPKEFRRGFPLPVAVTQPAFFADDRLLAIPTLEFYADPGRQSDFRTRFSPPITAGEADFAIV